MKPTAYGPFRYSPIIRRPVLRWPGGARLAVWVIPNIEYFPLNEKVLMGAGIVPDVMAWSHRDYGARVGIFRIMEVLDRYKVRGTVALNSLVCDAYPPIIEECQKRNWEFMGHNETNSRTLIQIPPESERDVVNATFDRIEKATGTRPKGWLSSGLTETWGTLDYLVEAGCQYVCDWVNDDQPYPMEVAGKRLMSIPYSSEINDFGFFMRFGGQPDDFAAMIRRQFDVLYRESETSGRVMAICLHPFIIGVAHRIGALESALEHIAGHDKVWFATGSEIIDAYVSNDVSE